MAYTTEGALAASRQGPTAYSQYLSANPAPTSPSSNQSQQPSPTVQSGYSSDWYSQSGSAIQSAYSQAPVAVQPTPVPVTPTVPVTPSYDYELKISKTPGVGTTGLVSPTTFKEREVPKQVEEEKKTTPVLTQKQKEEIALSFGAKPTSEEVKVPIKPSPIAQSPTISQPTVLSQSQKEEIAKAFGATPTSKDIKVIIPPKPEIKEPPKTESSFPGRMTTEEFRDMSIAQTEMSKIAPKLAEAQEEAKAVFGAEWREIPIQVEVEKKTYDIGRMPSIQEMAGPPVLSGQHVSALLGVPLPVSPSQKVTAPSGREFTVGAQYTPETIEAMKYEPPEAPGPSPEKIQKEIEDAREYAIKIRLSEQDEKQYTDPTQLGSFNWTIIDGKLYSIGDSVPLGLPENPTIEDLERYWSQKDNQSKKFIEKYQGINSVELDGEMVEVPGRIYIAPKDVMPSVFRSEDIAEEVWKKQEKYLYGLTTEETQEPLIPDIPDWESMDWEERAAWQAKLAKEGMEVSKQLASALEAKQSGQIVPDVISIDGIDYPLTEATVGKDYFPETTLEISLKREKALEETTAPLEIATPDTVESSTLTWFDVEGGEHKIGGLPHDLTEEEALNLIHAGVNRVIGVEGLKELGVEDPEQVVNTYIEEERTSLEKIYDEAFQDFVNDDTVVIYNPETQDIAQIGMVPAEERKGWIIANEDQALTYSGNKNSVIESGEFPGQSKQSFISENASDPNSVEFVFSNASSYQFVPGKEVPEGWVKDPVTNQWIDPKVVFGVIPGKERAAAEAFAEGGLDRLIFVSGNYYNKLNEDQVKKNEILARMIDSGYFLTNETTDPETGKTMASFAGYDAPGALIAGIVTMSELEEVGMKPPPSSVSLTMGSGVLRSSEFNPLRAEEEYLGQGDQIDGKVTTGDLYAYEELQDNLGKEENKQWWRDHGYSEDQINYMHGKANPSTWEQITGGGKKTSVGMGLLGLLAGGTTEGVKWASEPSEKARDAEVKAKTFQLIDMYKDMGYTIGWKNDDPSVDIDLTTLEFMAEDWQTEQEKTIRPMWNIESLISIGPGGTFNLPGDYKAGPTPVLSIPHTQRFWNELSTTEQVIGAATGAVEVATLSIPIAKPLTGALSTIRLAKPFTTVSGLGTKLTTPLKFVGSKIKLPTGYGPTTLQKPVLQLNKFFQRPGITRVIDLANNVKIKIVSPIKTPLVRELVSGTRTEFQSPIFRKIDIKKLITKMDDLKANLDNIKSQIPDEYFSGGKIDLKYGRLIDKYDDALEAYNHAKNRVDDAIIRQLADKAGEANKTLKVAEQALDAELQAGKALVSAELQTQVQEARLASQKAVNALNESLAQTDTVTSDLLKFVENKTGVKGLADKFMKAGKAHQNYIDAMTKENMYQYSSEDQAKWLTNAQEYKDQATKLAGEIDDLFDSYGYKAPKPELSYQLKEAEDLANRVNHARSEYQSYVEMRTQFGSGYSNPQEEAEALSNLKHAENRLISYLDNMDYVPLSSAEKLESSSQISGLAPRYGAKTYRMELQSEGIETQSKVSTITKKESDILDIPRQSPPKTMEKIMSDREKLVAEFEDLNAGRNVDYFPEWFKKELPEVYNSLRVDKDFMRRLNQMSSSDRYDAFDYVNRYKRAADIRYMMERKALPSSGKNFTSPPFKLNIGSDFVKAEFSKIPISSSKAPGLAIRTRGLTKKVEDELVESMYNRPRNLPLKNDPIYDMWQRYGGRPLTETELEPWSYLGSAGNKAKLRARLTGKNIIDPNLSSDWKKAMDAYKIGDMDTYETILNGNPVLKAARERTLALKKIVGLVEKGDKSTITHIYKRNNYLRNNLIENLPDDLKLKAYNPKYSKEDLKYTGNLEMDELVETDAYKFFVEKGGKIDQLDLDVFVNSKTGISPPRPPSVTPSPGVAPSGKGWDLTLTPSTGGHGFAGVHPPSVTVPELPKSPSVTTPKTSTISKIKTKIDEMKGETGLIGSPEDVKTRESARISELKESPYQTLFEEIDITPKKSAVMEVETPSIKITEITAPKIDAPIESSPLRPIPKIISTSTPLAGAALGFFGVTVVPSPVAPIPEIRTLPTLPPVLEVPIMQPNFVEVAPLDYPKEFEEIPIMWQEKFVAEGGSVDYPVGFGYPRYTGAFYGEYPYSSNEFQMGFFKENPFLVGEPSPSPYPQEYPYEPPPPIDTDYVVPWQDPPIPPPPSKPPKKGDPWSKFPFPPFFGPSGLTPGFGAGRRSGRGGTSKTFAGRQVTVYLPSIAVGDVFGSPLLSKEEVAKTRKTKYRGSAGTPVKTKTKTSKGTKTLRR